VKKRRSVVLRLEITALAQSANCTTSAVTPTMSTKDTHDNSGDKGRIDFKQAVFARDRHRCNNCKRDIGDVITLDPDHTVPRGVGGSNRMSNIGALCRRCHEAKHGDGTAPCAQVVSSGRMADDEFLWFKQLINEMIPALARKYSVNLHTYYSLDGTDAWFLPIGDLHLLDEKLGNDDSLEEYTQLRDKE